MSRRSSRRAPKKAAAALPESVQRGLASLVQGNESVIASMLSVDLSSKSAGKDKEGGSEEAGASGENNNRNEARLVSALSDGMAMNDLSAEALLARFFDVAVLRTYCTSRLGVSGKGNEATLAARIGRAWAKSDFEALPMPEHAKSVPKSKRSPGDGKGKKEGKKTRDASANPAKKKQRTEPT